MLPLLAWKHFNELPNQSSASCVLLIDKLLLYQSVTFEVSFVYIIILIFKALQHNWPRLAAHLLRTTAIPSSSLRSLAHFVFTPSTTEAQASFRKGLLGGLG